MAFVVNRNPEISRSFGSTSQQEASDSSLKTTTFDSTKYLAKQTKLTKSLLFHSFCKCSGRWLATGMGGICLGGAWRRNTGTWWPTVTGDCSWPVTSRLRTLIGPFSVAWVLLEIVDLGRISLIFRLKSYAGRIFFVFSQTGVGLAWNSDMAHIDVSTSEVTCDTSLVASKWFCQDTTWERPTLLPDGTVQFFPTEDACLNRSKPCAMDLNHNSFFILFQGNQLTSVPCYRLSSRILHQQDPRQHRHTSQNINTCWRWKYVFSAWTRTVDASERGWWWRSACTTRLGHSDEILNLGVVHVDQAARIFQWLTYCPNTTNA